MTTAAKIKTDVETPPLDFETIVKDLAALRRDFSVLTSQLKSGANGAVEDTLIQLGAKATHLYDSVATHGGRSAKAISRHIDEQPVMSLLIAFGIGYLANRLLTR